MLIGAEIRLMGEGLFNIFSDKLSNHKSYGCWRFELDDGVTVMTRRGVSVKHNLNMLAQGEDVYHEAIEAINLSVSRLSEWPNLLTRQ